MDERRSSRKKDSLLSVGAILAEGKSARIESPVESGKLWSRWHEIVGEDIARHAQPSSLRHGVLRVRAESPAWATEVGYLGEEIAARANTVVGKKLVREVRTWTGPTRSKTASSGGSSPDLPAHGNPLHRSRRRAPADDPFVAVARAQKSWLEWRRKKTLERSGRPFSEPR